MHLGLVHSLPVWKAILHFNILFNISFFSKIRERTGDRRGLASRGVNSYREAKIASGDACLTAKVPDR